jgi:hypothetical protein
MRLKNLSLIILLIVSYDLTSQNLGDKVPIPSEKMHIELATVKDTNGLTPHKEFMKPHKFGLSSFKNDQSTNKQYLYSSYFLDGTICLCDFGMHCAGEPPTSRTARERFNTMFYRISKIDTTGIILYVDQNSKIKQVNYALGLFYDYTKSNSVYLAFQTVIDEKVEIVYKVIKRNQLISGGETYSEWTQSNFTTTLRSSKREEESRR